MNKLLVAAAIAASVSLSAFANDGSNNSRTTIVIEGTHVSIVDANGVKTPAPAGTHELSDGTVITVGENGELISSTPAQ